MRFRKVSEGETPGYRDVARFEKALHSSAGPICEGFADGTGGVTVARVPGRLDVMGGIADYCGSVVCEGTLGPAAVLALQKRTDRAVRIRSIGLQKEGLKDTFLMSLDDFYRGGSLVDYAAAREFFKRDRSTSWAAYLAGAFLVLLRERPKIAFPSGFNVVLQSSIPLGVGIGSSAAIEVAMMHALNRRLGLGLEGIELARLCQIVENRVVGAPCGIMDQVVSTLGKEGQLLAIKCQPGEVLRSVPLPDSCAVAGISSRVKHSVGGTQYTDVRVGAFMGHKIILNHLKANPKDDPFGGYLSRVSPERYRKEFARFLPSEMLGADFLARHDETVDPVTTVCAAKTYRVRSRTEHPIYENARVNRFIECLDRAVETGDERPLIQAGRLMYASHWSYRHRCGLDSPETLLLVNLARGIGVKGGIYGAKITGGGSGGTVAVLGRRETLAQNLQKMAERYEKATGITPDIFVGSSPGAEEFGHLEYAPEKGA